MARDCNLPIFTAHKTITNLTQYELSQEESDLYKTGLYFLIQADKVRKSKIFTTFEKIHHSFLNNLKSKESKSQIKRISLILLILLFTTTNLVHVYYINITSYKTSENIYRYYDNSIQEMFSDTSKFKKLNEDSNLKREALLQCFYRQLEAKNIIF